MLTDEGDKVFKKADELWTKAQTDFIKALGQEKLDQLNEIMEQIDQI